MAKQLASTRRKNRNLSVFRKTNGHCWFCGLQLVFSHKGLYQELQAWTIDHYIPRSQGGQNALDNLFPSCYACNQYKSNALLENFRHRIRTGYYGSQFRERFFFDGNIIFYGEL